MLPLKAKVAMCHPSYTALKVKREDGSDLLLEIEQHIGEDTARCVAMDSTDGLTKRHGGGKYRHIALGTHR